MYRDIRDASEWNDRLTLPADSLQPRDQGQDGDAPAGYGQRHHPPGAERRVEGKRTSRSGPDGHDGADPASRPADAVQDFLGNATTNLNQINDELRTANPTSGISTEQIDTILFGSSAQRRLGGNAARNDYPIAARPGDDHAGIARQAAAQKRRPAAGRRAGQEPVWPKSTRSRMSLPGSVRCAASSVSNRHDHRAIRRRSNYSRWFVNGMRLYYSNRPCATRRRCSCPISALICRRCRRHCATRSTRSSISSSATRLFTAQKRLPNGGSGKPESAHISVYVSISTPRNELATSTASTSRKSATRSSATSACRKTRHARLTHAIDDDDFRTRVLDQGQSRRGRSASGSTRSRITLPNRAAGSGSDRRAESTVTSAYNCRSRRRRLIPKQSQTVSHSGRSRNVTQTHDRR